MLFSSLLSSLSLALIPFTLDNKGSPSPTDILSIQHTLAQYPLSIDSKNFDRLSAVFTEDVYADYSPPIGILIGLPAVKQSLSSNLVNLTTQHSLTTQSIHVLSEGRADATTYFIATHFGIDETIYAGKVLWAYGRYEDQLKVTNNGVWKVYHRHLIYMVCCIILTMCQYTFHLRL
jgi:ketosteroid isomerase-like protein